MSNAVKSKSWLPHFRLAYTTTGGPAPLEWKTIATGQTIAEGAPLTITDDEVSAATATSGTLYGVAAAGGAAGESIPVYLATPENVFMGRVGADASAWDGPPESCDVSIVTGDFRVNLAGSTEEVLQVVAKVPGDDFDDDTVLPRVFFTIKRSQYDGRVAAK